MLLAGQKGHLDMLDWQSKKLHCEVHAQETVCHVKFLHTHNMFAAAQKKFVYVYDNLGTELHCLRQHAQTLRMEFLQYHFLLATASSMGHLRYHDTSTGIPLVDVNVRCSRLHCIAQNPSNAIVHLGHQNGVVSLWSPNQGKPLVRVLCHRGLFSAVEVDRGGNYMTTAGLDGLVRVWDLRMYKRLHQYSTGQAVSSLSISQRGLLAAGCRTDIKVWQNGLSQRQPYPYMQHHLTGRQIAEKQFCPFEDVLGVGHSDGFESLLIPGAGEANFDALEVNPYQTKRQKREKEVKQLLEKVPADLITLDPHAFHRGCHDTAEEEEEEKAAKFQPRFGKKGRSGSARRQQRKEAVKDRERTEVVRKAVHSSKGPSKSDDSKKRTALDRFGR